VNRHSRAIASWQPISELQVRSKANLSA
jgi:hypothetical protein